MSKHIQAKLIGGPLSNRSITVPDGAIFGQIIEVPMQKKSAGSVTLEQKHHYRLDPHPTEKVVANWVNPAERRQYGR
jgi:hypothetical protein